MTPLPISIPLRPARAGSLTRLTGAVETDERFRHLNDALLLRREPESCDGGHGFDLDRHRTFHQAPHASRQLMVPGPRRRLWRLDVSQARLELRDQIRVEEERDVVGIHMVLPCEEAVVGNGGCDTATPVLAVQIHADRRTHIIDRIIQLSHSGRNTIH